MKNENIIMKIKILICGFCFILPFLCWSQGKVTRPQKQETFKKEETNKTTKSKPAKSKVPLTNLTQTINGITVQWNKATQSQKDAITTVLNNMVYVQGGKFMMGSNDSEAYDDEKPLHMETVNSFWINKYEVTRELWKEIMGDIPSDNLRYGNEESLPVSYVDWNDCQDFIRKLNLLTGLNFRLPNEAEWEFAARGGKQSKGFKYSGSDNIISIGWYKDNAQRHHAVGSKYPNELGLYDMTGNVEEWTSDIYSDNYASPRNSTRYVVTRGGSGWSIARACRISNRMQTFPDYKNFNVGFRIAL